MLIAIEVAASRQSFVFSWCKLFQNADVSCVAEAAAAVHNVLGILSVEVDFPLSRCQCAMLIRIVVDDWSSSSSSSRPHDRSCQWTISKMIEEGASCVIRGHFVRVDWERRRHCDCCKVGHHWWWPRWLWPCTWAIISSPFAHYRRAFLLLSVIACDS